MKISELSEYQRLTLKSRLQSNDERELWRHTFSAFDLTPDMFEMSLQYVEVMRNYWASMADLRANGINYTLQDGTKKTNPAYRISQSAGESARKILKQISSHAPRASEKPKDISLKDL